MIFLLRYGADLGRAGDAVLDPGELREGFAVKVFVDARLRDLRVVLLRQVPEVDFAVEGPAREQIRLRRVKLEAHDRGVRLDHRVRYVRLEVSLLQIPDAHMRLCVAHSLVLHPAVGGRNDEPVAVPAHVRYLELLLDLVGAVRLAAETVQEEVLLAVVRPFRLVV